MKRTAFLSVVFILPFVVLNIVLLVILRASDYANVAIADGTLFAGEAAALFFVIEPDIWFDNQNPQPMDFEILTSSHGSIKLKLFIATLGNASGKLSKTAESCNIGVIPMHKAAAYAIPWQVSDGDRFKVNESSIVNDFKPQNPSQILSLLISTKFFSDERTDIDRGVNLNILVGFTIESTGEFYFATWPPRPFNLAEVGAEAYVDSEGQYPVESSVLFHISVSGKNFSRVTSRDYVVMGLKGKFSILRVGKMGKERRLNDEEVRKEKHLTPKDAHSAKPESSQESSPASASSTPFQSPHMTLDGQTPAETCGVKIEGENPWITLIQNASKSSTLQPGDVHQI